MKHTTSGVWSGTLVAATLALLMGACPSPVPPPPTADQVRASFPEAPPPMVERQPPLRIYLDGSGSMAGFLRPASSEFRAVVQSLLQRVVTSGYDATWQKLSGTATELAERRWSEMLSPGFYSDPDTPLAKVMARMLSDVRGRRMALLVSDLVQSEKDSDQLDLAKALRAFAAAGAEIELHAFRSRFQGAYDSESLKGCRLDLNVANRPYYLLVVAPARTSAEELATLVLHGLSPAETLRPSRLAVGVHASKDVGIVQRTSDERQLWDLAQSERTDRPPSGPCAAFSSLVERDTDPNRLGEAVFSVPLEVNGQLPLARPDLWAIEVVESDLDSPARLAGDPPPAAGPAAPPAMAAPAVEWQAEEDSEPARLLVRYRIPRPPEDHWRVHRVTFRVAPGNVKAPAWVAAWSCTDDSSEANAARTLHLDVLVEALARAVTERQVLLDHFIATRRRR